MSLSIHVENTTTSSSFDTEVAFSPGQTVSEIITSLFEETLTSDQTLSVYTWGLPEPYPRLTKRPIAIESPFSPPLESDEKATARVSLNRRIPQEVTLTSSWWRSVEEKRPHLLISITDHRG